MATFRATLRVSKLTYREVSKLTNGLSRNSIIHVMQNQWFVPQDYKNILLYHRLRNMSGEEFKNFMQDGQLFDPYMHTRFNIIYAHGTTPARAFKAQTVMCSYRLAPSELNIEPIVIVKIK